MSDALHRVQFGSSTIEYQLSYVPRKTLAIHVHPDLRVTVKAPPHTALDAVKARVLKRAAWILKQQRDFEKHLPHLPPRQYLSGETHRYLGRQYRLKIVEDQHERVKLARGRLFVHLPAPSNTERVKALVLSWYRRQAERVFHERLHALLPRFRHLGIEEPPLGIRAMKSRWGSCTEAGVILLNPKLIRVPKHYIDYVIAHELCHLVEHNHSKHFYLLLDSVMPDWRERRQRLNACD